MKAAVGIEPTHVYLCLESAPVYSPVELSRYFIGSFLPNGASWTRTNEYRSQSAVPYHLAIALNLLLGVTSRQGGVLITTRMYSMVMLLRLLRTPPHHFMLLYILIKLSLQSNPETSSESNAMDLEGLEPTTNRL